jgi:hypothetical protein
VATGGYRSEEEDSARLSMPSTNETRKSVGVGKKAML